MYINVNHGSHLNLICDDKEKLNFTEALKSLNEWKNKNYGLSNSEFQYTYIERKIFLEKYLGDELIDYNIFCFNGEPKFIRAHKKIKERIIRNNIHNHYNIDWKLNNLESGLKGYVRDPHIKFDKPKNLDLMLKYAKMLSQEFVFVRVDFYEVNNKVYLGELTFSPTNSFLDFKDKEQSIYVGKMMNLTKIKSYLFNK